MTSSHPLVSSETWPPPTSEYWKVIGSSAGLRTINIQLRGQEAPLLRIPKDALQMGKRLNPLLQIASITSWRMGVKKPNLQFSLQIHDEDPGAKTLRFDAALNDSTVLLPDPYALGSHGYYLIRESIQHTPLPAWRERIPIAFWRGSSTGSKAITVKRISNNLRIRLCDLSRQYPTELDARITDIVQCRDQDAKEELTELLRARGMLSRRIDVREFCKYQYLIEIDGNVNSWGLLWKLMTGCCILRVASRRRQWYHHSLKDYENIVPVAEDLSDLHKQLDWCRTHPNESEEIGRNGQLLAMQVVRNLGKSVLLAIDEFFENEVSKVTQR